VGDIQRALVSEPWNHILPNEESIYARRVGSDESAPVPMRQRKSRVGFPKVFDSELDEYLESEKMRSTSHSMMPGFPLKTIRFFSAGARRLSPRKFGFHAISRG
jgi:hypothetical protein